MTTDRIHVAPGEYIDEDGLSGAISSRRALRSAGAQRAVGRLLCGSGDVASSIAWLMSSAGSPSAPMHTEPTSWHANWHRQLSDVAAARKKRHAPGRVGARPAMGQMANGRGVARRSSRSSQSSGRHDGG
jgi:hypothetical protein